MKAFTSFGHSGGSASIAKQQLAILLDHENLAPLTDDPDEWEDRSEMSSQPWWQNKRNSKAMSHDGGKTYWIVGGSEVSLDGQVEKEMFTSVEAGTHEANRQRAKDVRSQRYLESGGDEPQNPPPSTKVFITMDRSSWHQIEDDLENQYGMSLSDTEVGASIVVEGDR